MTTAFIGGDVWPAAAGLERMQKQLPALRESSLLVFALDCAVETVDPRRGVTRIAVDPDVLHDFRCGAKTVAVLATNHVADFGELGIQATQSALERAGISWVGAGRDENEAGRHLVLDVGGRRLAVLSFAETAPRCGAVAASRTSAGANRLERERTLSSIRTAASAADDVWVFLHWGEEFVRLPSPEQRDLVRAMIEAGGSAVFSSHPHVLAGCEKFSGGVAFHGLGNLSFPPYVEARGYRYRWHPMARQGLLVRADLGRHGWVFSWLRLHQDQQGRPGLSQRRVGSLPWHRLYGLSASLYRALFPLARLSDRIRHYTERVLFMSNDERIVRLGLGRFGRRS